MPIQISLSNAIGALQGLAGGGPGPGPGPGYTPPLDDYPNAAAAYSVRLLRTAYSGSALRVRRAVAPFDEQDIGFTAGGDLDEAAIVAFGGSDVLLVSAWYDQSGQSNHATQITPNSQPQIYNGTAVITENGKPAIDFLSKKLELTGINWTSTRSIFTTLTPVSFDGFDPVFGTRDASGNIAALVGTTANYRMQQYASGGFNNVDTGISITTDQQLIYSLFNGGSSEIAKDGGTAVSVSLQSAAAGNHSIGSRGTDTADGSSKIQEHIVWLSDQDAAGNRTGIETDINDYFSIYTVYNPDPATSGFLFDYPNASTAYSVRQLNNNATYAMRVRRAVAPFDEQDIGFDSNGDLDTAAIATFGGTDSLTVSAWYDQSGNQSHATQATAGQQPQIYNGTAVITENGKPAADFQGDVLFTSSNITLSDGAYFSLAVGTTNGGQNNVINASDGSPRVGQFVRASGGNTVQSIGFNSGGGAVTATGPSIGIDTQFLGTGECTGTLLTAYANGTGGTSRSHTNRTDAAPFYVGARSAGGNDAHNGYVQESIHWPTDQSSNRTGIESNINTYYSIY